MSPRRSRPRGARREEPPPLSSTLPVPAPAGWRAFSQAEAPKPYVCRYCNQTIAVGTPNVVAWPTGREDQRRHWHKGCWQRDRRLLANR